MTDIEQKARELANEVLNERGMAGRSYIDRDIYTHEALCRAIEQHEAFRQEVSDAMEQVPTKDWDVHPILWRFIIPKPKPKPDPLVEALDAMKDGRAGSTTESYAACIRAALEAAGYEIREKNDD